MQFPGLGKYRIYTHLPNTYVYLKTNEPIDTMYPVKTTVTGST